MYAPIPTDTITDQWIETIQVYLDSLPTTVKRVSSRSLKKSLHADSVYARTWTRIIQQVMEQRQTSKKSIGEYGAVWKLEGQSLVRATAESYGFVVEGGDSSKVA